MTQPTSQQPQPAKPKSSASLKWVVVVVVVVVIIAGVVVVLMRPPQSSQKSSPPLSLSPTTTGISAQAGTNITFYTGLPSNAVFTKVVWNFGNGQTHSIYGIRKFKNVYVF